ncbi:MAG: alpha/beta hydrolase [Acidobacteria bacterium]|nr:MAG: alpha/beta hydrolase [Acidobacteriota bacterium]
MVAPGGGSPPAPFLRRFLGPSGDRRGDRRDRRAATGAPPPAELRPGRLRTADRGAGDRGSGRGRRGLAAGVGGDVARVEVGGRRSRGGTPAARRRDRRRPGGMGHGRPPPTGAALAGAGGGSRAGVARADAAAAPRARSGRYISRSTLPRGNVNAEGGPPMGTGTVKLVFAAAAILVAPAPAIAGGEPAADLAGTWSGALDVGGVRLRLVLHLERTPEGGYTGTMDSLDQGANGLELAAVTLDGSEFSFTVPVASARYEGRLSEDARRIEGRWLQSGLELPLAFERSEEPPKLSRPQEPRPPYPYRTADVRFPSSEGVTLAGTLTLPPGEGPHPAAVLLSGSGPQDRDETVFGHRPFLVLSDALTRRGIAVLRFDDRGVGASTGDFAAATSEDFARDAAAAVAFLRGQKTIDPARIGLVGHSEGALVAAMTAAEREDVAFVVLIAGPGVTGADLLVEQTARLAAAAGAAPEEVDKARAFEREAVDLVLGARGTDAAAARERLASLLAERLAEMPPDQRRAMGLPEHGATEGAIRRFAEAQAAQLFSPWFRFFLAYDPASDLKKIRCPVLAVSGELDLQVPPDQNLPAIAAALAEAPADDWTVAQLPGLNHLLQTAATGSPAEYSRIEETISPTALDVIGGWIARHTAAGDGS